MKLLSQPLKSVEVSCNNSDTPYSSLVQPVSHTLHTTHHTHTHITIHTYAPNEYITPFIPTIHIYHSFTYHSYQITNITIGHWHPHTLSTHSSPTTHITRSQYRPSIWNRTRHTYTGSPTLQKKIILQLIWVNVLNIMYKIIMHRIKHRVIIVQ
jgi:hypothetical protein